MPVALGGVEHLETLLGLKQAQRALRRGFFVQIPVGQRRDEDDGRNDALRVDLPEQVKSAEWDEKGEMPREIVSPELPAVDKPSFSGARNGVSRKVPWVALAFRTMVAGDDSQTILILKSGTVTRWLIQRPKQSIDDPRRREESARNSFSNCRTPSIAVRPI